jgi:hypothetical protein
MFAWHNRNATSFHRQTRKGAHKIHAVMLQQLFVSVHSRNISRLYEDTKNPDYLTCLHGSWYGCVWHDFSDGRVIATQSTEANILQLRTSIHGSPPPPAPPPHTHTHTHTHTVTTVDHIHCAFNQQRPRLKHETVPATPQSPPIHPVFKVIRSSVWINPRRLRWTIRPLAIKNTTSKFSTHALLMGWHASAMKTFCNKYKAQVWCRLGTRLFIMTPATACRLRSRDTICLLPKRFWSCF